MSDTTQNSYKASHIKVLEGLEPVRKRPGMYIGSTDSKGLHHLAKEILDNAVDEAIAGFGKNIQLFRSNTTEAEQKLANNPDLGDEVITVVDNGRGIPVEMHESGVSALEVVMTKLHAGGKFEETAYQASGGLHGVGSSAVNALSALMQVVVKRDSRYYYQWYSKGVPGQKVSEITLEEVKQIFPDQLSSFTSYQTGTIVKFIPDKTIFSTTTFGHNTLVQIIKDRAYLMAGIYFELNDLIAGVNKHYYFEGGIRSLVEHLNMSKKALHDVFYVSGVWQDETTHKKIGVEAALQYNDSYNEKVESYVNVINTPDGGTHVNGFRTALGRVLRDYAEKNGLLKEKESFVADDLREGLTAVVFVKMPANDLQFESQTKSKLNNAEAQTAVYQIFKDNFVTFLEENPKVGREIVGKIMLSARARMAARAAKDAVIRKGLLEGNSLPGKLADCQSHEAAESEIYIVEGDSAGGCFSGDTKVALADGRNLSFLEIISEQNQGKKHFCYTIRRDGKIGLAPVINPRQTKASATVIKLTLDSGETIVCTPDHRFMLRTGKYCRADKLTTQDSIMPLYKKISDRKQKGITIDGYEMVWDPKSNQWLFTHKLAQWTSEFRQKRKETLGNTYFHKTLSCMKNFVQDSGLIDLAAYAEHRRSVNDKTLLKFETFTQKYFGGDQISSLEVIANYNHKIVKVEKLSEKIPVYDIEVPGSHNFALSSGVFVHNSAKQGRDRRFQAIFPLRGKILNTERARIDKVVAFEELKNLVIALGAGIGDTFDAGKLRYHRIILMNDADVDGEHITTLGLTFFFRHLPAIVEQGYLYVAMPPLYKVTHNKKDNYVYTEEEKDAAVAEIQKTSPNAKIELQRYKGLGEMNPEQLWETTMNPKTRTLKKVTIADAANADRTFSVLMGDEVAPRKKFIQSHAQLADLDI
ncbi:MAG: ATP-binding protein [Patescibacteria group bacterium]